MSFTTDPAVASRLADRNWRIIHSLWIATPIVCCGIFSCAGFIYAAGRVRNRKWNIIAAVSTVVTIAVCVCLFAFENAEDEVPDWAGGVMIASCIAHLLAGLALRNSTWCASRSGRRRGPGGYGTTASAPTASARREWAPRVWCRNLLPARDSSLSRRIRRRRLRCRT